MNRFIQFLREVRVELAKVSWPTREQLVTYTLTVLGLSLFLAVFLGAVDSLFVFVLNKFIAQ